MKFLESWLNSFIIIVFEEKFFTKASWYSNHANSYVYSLHPIKGNNIRGNLKMSRAHWYHGVINL